MRMAILLASCVLLQPLSALAQQGTGVFATYTFTHPDFESLRYSAGDHLNGWSAGAELPLAGVLQLVARADGEYGTKFKTGAIFLPVGTFERPAVYDFVAGPRVAYTMRRVSPWADATFGVTHATARAMGVDAFLPSTDNALAAGAGGGLDVRVARHLDVRVVDVEYEHATLFDQRLNRVSASAGAVLRFNR